MDVSKIKRQSGEGAAALLKKLEGISDKRLVRTITAPLLYFMAALALAEIEVTLGVIPFGVAIICTAGDFICASASLCGAALGCATLGEAGLWQIAICAAVYLFRLAASYIEKRKGFTIERAFREKRQMRVLAAAIASVGAGSITVTFGTNVYSDILAAISGFALYPAFTYAFILLTTRSAKQQERILGLGAAAFALCHLLESWTLPFRAAVAASLAITLILTFTNGPMAGMTIGILSGMALEAPYAPMIPLAALAASLIHTYSASLAVVAGSLAALSWAFGISGFGAMGDIFPEILFTSAILAPLANFGLLPKKELFAEPKEFSPPPHDNPLEKKLKSLSLSLDEISELLTDVSNQVQRPSAEEAKRICASARAAYCKGCVHEGICGKTEKSEVDGFFDRLQKELCQKGSASVSIAPPRLAARCYNMDKILDFSSTTAKISGRLAAESCKTRLFASDYKAIASLLRQSAAPEEEKWDRDKKSEISLREHFFQMNVEMRDVAVYGGRRKKIYLRGLTLPSTAGEADLRRESEKIVGTNLSSPEYTIDQSTVSAYLHTVPRFKIDAGKYSSAGKKDNFSGDTVLSFNNDDGYYYSLVSDGMGSGREAALTSGISALFLEKLLSSGAPMKSSLELLNAFICGGEGECFTTVDLMESDLYTGKTSFIKSGAAPSFVLRGGKVFRLHSKTVPIGIIRALDAERITFDIADGDMIVMISDGVTGSYEACPWLYELLEGHSISALPPKQAAKAIGEAAERETGREDDITVAVMKVKECA